MRRYIYDEEFKLCASFKDKYNRRYGLVYMAGYGVPVQGCTMRVLHGMCYSLPAVVMIRV